MLLIFAGHDRERNDCLQGRCTLADVFEATWSPGNSVACSFVGGPSSRAVRNVKVGVIIRAGSKIIVIGYLTVGAAVEIVH